VTLAAVAASLLATAALTPQQKAALVVVSGLPAPTGVGGVIVRRWDRDAPRPPGALVFVDQEGGAVRAFPDAPPSKDAASFATPAEALAAGRATRRALRTRGVHVDLAPVLDLRGPLGARHFRRPSLGIAFARGLGDAACVKHFPGLGTAAVSTDERPHVDARIRAADLAPFAAAIGAGVPCVMTSNAFYGGARYRASISPVTYRRLRTLGFDGVAITDSLSIVRAAPVERWSRQAIRAGADLLLFPSPAHARRAIASLLPLARTGELDVRVARVLRYRSRLLQAPRP
jgi:beta-N-acetylhexosaminidase